MRKIRNETLPIHRSKSLQIFCCEDGQATQGFTEWILRMAQTRAKPASKRERSAERTDPAVPQASTKVYRAAARFAKG